MITIVIAILLLLIGVVFMAFKVLMVKGGQFPSGHHHDLLNSTKNKTKK